MVDLSNIRSRSKRSKAQAATAAGVGERTIDRAIGAGELAASKTHGRVVIERSELRRWMATRQARQARGRRRTPLLKVRDYVRGIVALETGSEASPA